MIKNLIPILFFSLMYQGLAVGASVTDNEDPDKPEVKGKVTDKEGEPIPFASVALYRSADSTLVTGSTTDEKGFFSIGAKPGDYYLKITFLSYKEKLVPDVNLSNEGINLGNIILYASSVDLQEVQVQGERSQMELKLDKRVFNVGQDLSNTGRNASEILENVPSVTVDVDGNVALRGSQNVRILINGKPSGLVGISGTDALRQLPGNMIEKIEVITNPSARYDAEGEVGIINIILKKNFKEGVNGNFEVTAGYPDNYRASANVNFRKKYYNLFGGYTFGYRKTPGKGHNFQEFKEMDTSYNVKQYREHTRGGLSNNINAGADIFLNTFNTLTISGLYQYSDENNHTKITYKDFDENGLLTRNVLRDEDESEIEHNLEGGISYRKTFLQKDRLFTIDLKYIDDKDPENANVTQTSTVEETVNQRWSNTENERNLLFQSDYVHPFSKDGKFETGVKGTMREINNKYKVEELTDNEEWQVLPNYDDHFVYDENIYAAYMMAGNKSGKFSYQGGLRAEYSDITTDLKETNETNHRNYLDWFPSTHFSYELDSANTLQLSYSRRLSRPRFRHLLPFSSYSDSRNFWSGNPDLNPEYTNSFELGFLRYFKKGSLLSSIYYRYRTGVIERITIVDSASYTRRIPVNLSTQNAFGLEFNMNYNIAKWWRVNGNFNFYRAITNGNYNGEHLSSDTYAWTTRASSNMKLWKKVDFQASINYRGPHQEPQGRNKAMYSVDLGAAMDLLNKKATLSFSVRDLLNTRKWRSITDTYDYYAETEFQWRARQFLVSLNYRLNQKKRRERANDDFNGGDDEF